MTAALDALADLARWITWRVEPRGKNDEPTLSVRLWGEP
jgi:hypothetical protein